MKRRKQRLIIPFSGLKLGKHVFNFEIGKEFFEQFDFSIIQDASFEVEVEFNKKSNLLELEFAFHGFWNTNCDRCNDPLQLKLEGNEELIVKFGEETYSETDEIKVIPFDAYELDITKEVYEFIHLQLPSKAVHEKSEDCNQEVIKKLEEFTDINTKTDSVDPRWAALEKLKQTNKSD
jgi:uncharacterized metal-binding protein YceD (DUF177 family)